MFERKRGCDCGSIEGVSNDLKVKGLAMGYRTLKVSTSCEIHIKEGQLEVTSFLLRI